MCRFNFSSSLSCLAVVLASGRVMATEPTAPEVLPRLAAPADRYLGGLSCASASCHGRQDEVAEPGSVSRREYVLWLEHDPHARSARTLESPEFQRILRHASSGRDDGPADAAVESRCAKCHNPSEKGTGVFSSRGIDCESCHGPAKDWIAVHYERDVTRQRLVELGMTDTKDLVVRAKLCAGCHVGDGERDMNHDMIAAGHPPLRFELSAYHDLIRQKHWPAAERVRMPEFKANLWAAGQAAALLATLDLVASRASRAATGDKLTPWPELAEYDCFACHQRLRPASGFSSVALKGDRPGVPGWQPWNLALSRSKFAELSREMSGSLVTDALKVRELAMAARGETTFPESVAPRGILALVTPAIRDDASWAARCQQLLALRAIDLAIRDERLRLQPPPGFVTVTNGREEPRREAVDDWDRDWRSVAAALHFGSPQFEWPAFDWEGLGAPPVQKSPPLTAEQIGDALARLADDLRKQGESTNP